MAPSKLMYLLSLPRFKPWGNLQREIWEPPGSIRQNERSVEDFSNATLCCKCYQKRPEQPAVIANSPLFWVDILATFLLVGPSSMKYLVSNKSRNLFRCCQPFLRAHAINCFNLHIQVSLNPEMLLMLWSLVPNGFHMSNLLSRGSSFSCYF